MISIRRAFVFLLALFASSAALADIVIKPSGATVWELVVFGNATAVAEVLKGVTLMMAPSEQGGHGFRSLMVFMALLGFLISMIQAVADPGKNLLKAVTYILVAWAISYFTVTVKANVAVIDQLSGQTIVVDKVPALASVPASVVSQIGVFLTKEFEKNLTIPGSMKMSESGQAMLFSRVMQAANEVRITDPEILKSMQAYVANCTVPAVARGRMTLGGLLSSPNYVDELGKASYNAVLTSFYPSMKNFTEDNKPNPEAGFSKNCLSTAIDAAGGKVDMAEAKGNQGILLTCKEAYTCMRADLENFASAALSASGSQMGTSGANVTMEQALSDALALQSRGQAYSGQFSSPNGYLMQRAAISSLSGSFRAAAIKSGNNEYLQAAAGAQAEAQQRSSWIAAAHSFRNIMGYIYMILQTFVFAIVPVVVIAMFIPGAGAGMVKNYFQVLIWLVLWMPLLSVVSYLSTLFAVSDLQGPFNAAGGLTAGNAGAISEKAAALSDAADFMAASIPMFTWGLVKGAMAFTEFISHGLGMNYAQQAGATATTGNLSMNNMSMDSFNANKFSNVISSATGTQQVQGYGGAGGLMFDQQSGGRGFGINGAQAAASTQIQKSIQDSLSATVQTNHQKSVGAGDDMSKGIQKVLQENSSIMQQGSVGHNMLTNLAKDLGSTKDSDKREQIMNQFAQDFARRAQEGFSAGFQPGKIIGVSAGVEGSDQASSMFGFMASLAGSSGVGGGSRAGNSQQAADSFFHNFGINKSDGLSDSTNWSGGMNQTWKSSHDFSVASGAAQAAQKSLSEVESFTFQQGMDRQTFEAQTARLGQLQSELGGRLDGAATATGGAADVLAGRRAIGELAPADINDRQAALASQTPDINTPQPSRGGLENQYKAWENTTGHLKTAVAGASDDEYGRIDREEQQRRKDRVGSDQYKPDQPLITKLRNDGDTPPTLPNR